MADTAHSQSISAVAREIMGRNFFGIEEAVAHFGVNASQHRPAYLAEIPFAESVLEECKDTHILAAVFPLSILDIRGAWPNLFYAQSWYNKQAFAKGKGEVAWQLIRKTPVDDSTSKTWDEQNKLLGKDEEVSKARPVIYTMIGHYKATGERLFERVWVRCSDLLPNGARVDVGDFDAGGLGVNLYWDGGRFSDLGLSASRKSRASKP